jgi:GntR family transcriptional regulator, transcriptional repressor for pyruvate dehydrogenase complex
VLETEAAGRAAQLITDAAVREASDILAQVEPMVSTSDDHFGAFIEADIAFHRVIAHASGNPALEALIEALASRTVRGRLWRAISEEGALHSTHREHQAILQAIARRDPDAARIRMATHLLAVQEFLHDHPEVAGIKPLAVLDHQPPSVSG